MKSGSKSSRSAARVLILEAKECTGVAGMVWDSISRCEVDIRKTLLGNVVLSGGRNGA